MQLKAFELMQSAFKLRKRNFLDYLPLKKKAKRHHSPFDWRFGDRARFRAFLLRQ
jgi:hypothetical protein